MKKMLMKAAAIVFSVMMVLTLFSACGSQQSGDADMDAIVDAAVKAALEATATSAAVTIEADGRQVTIEDTAGKSVQQLLEQAEITLNAGDVLSVVPDQVLAEGITIRVLRKTTVSIVVSGEDPQNDIRYTAVLVGGTVADAIAAVGVELADNQIVSYGLEEALLDGMEITVAVKAEEETQVTEPDTSASDDSSSSNSGSSANSGSSSNSGSSANSGSNSGSGSGSNSGSGSDSGSGSGSNSDSGSGTENERYIVSVDTYYDCDGSGHGVKIITYSDGTQEEVYF